MSIVSNVSCSGLSDQNAHVRREDKLNQKLREEAEENAKKIILRDF